MNIDESLQSLGLTNSEIKVYLALLELGISSKGKILEKAKIAPSKIYIVLNKLIDKGLVSLIIKNNIRHYQAAPVSRISDYLNLKKEEFEKQEQNIKDLMPKLENLQKSIRNKTTAEIFYGWKGMETVYSSLYSEAVKDDAYILGASKGDNLEKTKLFYQKWSFRARLKNIKLKIIFNENDRDYVKSLEKELKIKYNKRFLQKTTPVEFLITKNTSAIIMLKEEPLVILIKDEETAASFIAYFKELWNIAKK